MRQERSKPRHAIREDFARFYEAPSRETLRDLLKNHVGELPVVDFKESWPSAAKLARHILAFANSGGGIMIVGVRERDDKSLEACGLASLVDKSDILNGVKRFLPDVLGPEILDFAYEASEYPTIVGKRFQVLIADSETHHLPFLSLSAGEGIKNNTVYVRRGAASEEANHGELQRLINRRIETGYSSRPAIDLAGHVEQLKVLYSNIEREHTSIVFTYREPSLIRIAREMAGQREDVIANPAYPQESFDQFIARMIERKKRVIERMVAGDTA